MGVVEMLVSLSPCVPGCSSSSPITMTLLLSPHSVVSVHGMGRYMHNVHIISCTFLSRNYTNEFGTASLLHNVVLYMAAEEAWLINPYHW